MSLPDWAPELQDVGAVARARTRSDATGGELGTFDATTHPTATEVLDFIDHAVTELDLRLPDEIAPKHHAFLKRLAAIRVAMMIEVAIEPERTSGDQSAYARYQELYDTGWTALNLALVQSGTGGTIGRLVSVPLASPYGVPGAPVDDTLDELLG